MKQHTVLLAVVWLATGCTPREPVAIDTPAKEIEKLEFGVYWPPQDPADPAGPAGDPLLEGALCVRPISTSDESVGQAELWVTVSRPNDEEHREAWNARLAYRHLDWMRQVRVWDDQQQWLWPNLPYLLRAHGTSRIERYGGVDPGKGVDNDFAAVLIREYDATGDTEATTTRTQPLVSAEWLPVDGESGDRESIVHHAESERFRLHLRPSDSSRRGRLGLWLIYADFMGAPVPQAWPKQREFAGGILAYFEIDWTLDPGGGCHLKIAQRTPPGSTGFDWAKWIDPADESKNGRAEPRLTNSPGS